MKTSKGVLGRIGEGRQLETAGQLKGAAAVYQKIIDTDPGNQAVVGRLLVIYRKGKEYRKELAVINGALAAYKQRDKALQDKWIKEHPKAAGAGRSVLRQLEKGGGKASAFGVDPVVNGWIKRKAFVTKRIAGKTGNAGGKKKKANVETEVGKTSAANPQNGSKAKKPANVQKKEVRQHRKIAAGKKGAIIAAQRKLALQHKEEARKKAVQKRMETADARRKKALERKAAAVARKKETQARARKEAAATRKAEALAKKNAALVVKMHPSLFVISLRYLVPLEKIDAVMPKHIAYLNSHYKKGDFLVSGRLVPRTGGIIIARGKDRNAVERMVKVDPFVKGKLASVNIVEFSASQAGKGLERLLKGTVSAPGRT